MNKSEVQDQALIVLAAIQKVLDDQRTNLEDGRERVRLFSPDLNEVVRWEWIRG
jgi:hypothetical protein